MRSKLPPLLLPLGYDLVLFSNFLGCGKSDDAGNLYGPDTGGGEGTRNGQLEQCKLRLWIHALFLVGPELNTGVLNVLLVRGGGGPNGGPPLRL